MKRFKSLILNLILTLTAISQIFDITRAQASTPHGSGSHETTAPAAKHSEKNPVKTVEKAHSKTSEKTSAKTHETIATQPAVAAPKTSSSSEKLHWTAWYIVETLGGIPYQYYKDEVKSTDGKLHFLNQSWKKEEDYINEESLGAFSEDNDQLKPLFFNFKSTYRSQELQIDGTFQPDGSVVIKKTVNGQAAQPLKRTPSRNAIFSSFFPVWLSLHLKKLKPGEIKVFYTLQEDDGDSQFNTMNGKVRLDKQDDIAKKTNTTKVFVEYRGIQSNWWVDSKGIAERIEMPAQKLVVRKVSEDEAKKVFSK